MKSPNQFIVVPKNDRRYDNIKDIDGTQVILDVSEESYSFSNREAVVLSTPINYTGPIEEGDSILVHHNVFKFFNDMHGRRQSGKSFFRDNKFFVDDTQYYMYKKISEWYAVEPFCFVSPLPKIDTYIYKNITNEPLMGVMEYTCSSIDKHGIKKGDVVTFMPDSEYEFRLDDRILYRIRSKNIIAYESKRD